MRPNPLNRLFASVTALPGIAEKTEKLYRKLTGRETGALSRAALSIPYPDRILIRAPTDTDLAPDHPARAKIKAAPAGAAFVCVGERCSLPVEDAQAIAGVVAAMRA